MIELDHFLKPVEPFTPARRVRPRLYSEEIADTICERVSNGELLDKICAEPGMPNAATVYRWRGKHPEFDKMYECALLARFDKRCAELEAIAADGSHDSELVAKDDGTPTVQPNKESLGRSKLRIDTLKWIMAKELPRKYGEVAPMQVQAAAPPAAPEQPALPAPSNNVIQIKAALDTASGRQAAVAAK